MASLTGSTSPSAQKGRTTSKDDHHVSPSDIAVGVIIGRTSEFFDFFVYGIASVLVFPKVFFPFADPLKATLYAFVVFSLAFIARRRNRKKPENGASTTTARRQSCQNR